MANISANAILSYGQVTAGGKTYTFQTSGIYKAAPISTATGITYIAPEAFTGADPLVKIEQLLRSGMLVRLSALIANPTDGLKNKTAKILCEASLGFTARAGLVGKTLQYSKGGRTIIIGKVIKIRGTTRDRFS